MGKVRIITLVICVIAFLCMTPHLYYSDFKQEIRTEQILHKRETISNEGTPRYYFILDDKGSLLVTPKAFYTHEKGQTFTYAYGNTKKEKIEKAYVLIVMLIFISTVIFSLYRLFTSDEFN